MKRLLFPLALLSLLILTGCFVHHHRHHGACGQPCQMQAADCAKCAEKCQTPCPNCPCKQAPAETAPAK